MLQEHMVRMLQDGYLDKLLHQQGRRVSGRPRKQWKDL